MLRAALGLCLVASLGGLACRGDIRDHVAWGDRLLGAGKAEAALAEYQVALRQRGDDPDVLLRLAHGYAELGRLDDASEFYGRLLARDSGYVDQAVADFVQMARRAWERGDRARLARALETVQDIRPGAIPADLMPPFAEHYYDLGEYARALPLFLSALADGPASERGRILYPLARSYEELGDCVQALSHFQRFLALQAAGSDGREARWHAGNCAYQVALGERSVGRLTEALRLLELVIGYGAPEAMLDDAWFERGELLFALGRYDEALAAYRRVLELNPSRTGRLVKQAEERIRAIRYRS